MSIVGANAADFSQSSACAPPVTLSPQATCQIEITFAASIPGVENAALSFTDNATGSPQSVNLTGTGTEALASPSTPALNFGSQGEGTTSAQQVATVLNGGNSPLNIALVAITGADTAQFELRGVDTCTNPPTVAPGQTCSLGVAFAPQSVGNFSAQLQFTDNSGNAAAAVQTVTLLGAGVAASPIANVSPSAVNFASQLMNSAAAPQSVTLANTGSLALQVSAIALTGINANEFAFASGTNCPLTGGKLNAGAQCQLNVTFTPTAATAASAAITFSDTASNSPQSVALSGTTVSASLAVAPLNLNFASQTVGIATSPQSVTISNSGTSAIQIGGITTTGSNPSDFTVSYNCPGTLNAGAMCAINVAFQPTAGGQRAAVIVVSDNAPGSPQTVAVQGIGLVPAISLSASTLTFSHQLVGTASAAQSIGISNPGTGALSISGFTLSGPNTSDFTAAQNCGTALAPGAACSVTVSYQPAAAGASSAMLTIDDNVPGTPVSISLSGAGTDYSVVAQPGDPLSVVVAVGNPATYDLQISPEDGFTATVALACTGAPTNATCTLSTSSLAVAGASAAPFTVQIATVAGTALAPAAKLPRQPPPPPGSLPLLTVALIACLGIALGVRFALLDLRMRRSSAFKAAFGAIAGAIVIAGLAGSLSSCGSVGGGGTGANMQSDTPPGTYTITVTGTTQGASRTVQLTLDVQ
jgi:hypothetical protein